MAIQININGTVTLDESLSLQNTGVFNGPEDNNDNDVSLATLLAGATSFYNRLFNTSGLGLDTTFASTVGVGQSASNFITVTGGTAVSMGFDDGNGGIIPTYTGSASGGVATGLFALDGDAISLFADPVLGNRMVLGVDADNTIVFAIFLDPSADLSSARVWTVQFEPLDNPDGTNHDDPVNLFDSLGVAVGSTLEFDFDELPSGANLFGVVGDTSNALIVMGRDPVFDANGNYTNQSDVIHTSQGGEGATIGVNNQMFDPGEGAYFTYVKNPNPNYLSGAPGGLTATEADDADNVLYTGGTLEVISASTTISQTQGNSLVGMRVTAYDVAGSPQGRDFATGIDGGAPIGITGVKVYNAAGTLVEDSALPGAQDPNVVISIAAGVATITGLDDLYTVEWTTTAVHDRVLIEGTQGKFDIGAFEITQPQPTPDQALDFTARATDYDGDFADAAFRIGIDGTGIYDDGSVFGV